MDSIIFTVDVGNTRTKFCIWKTLNESKPFLDFSDSSNTFDSTQNWLQALQLPTLRSFYWYISSVNRNKCASLQDVIRRNRPNDIVKIISLTDIPMPVRYDFPEKLGIDRAVAAYAGIQVLGRGKPFLVVDIGTAATIDYVDSSGTFRGGAILPGARLSAESLQAKTACLPLIEDPDNEKLVSLESSKIQGLLNYPATETQDAIRIGVCFSLVGAITAFYWKVRRINLSQKQDEEKLAILLAGGDAPLTMMNLQSYFNDLDYSLGGNTTRPEITIEPRLVLLGLRDLALASLPNIC